MRGLVTNLHKVVVGSVEIFVQFDHQTLEKRGEFLLLLAWLNNKNTTLNIHTCPPPPLPFPCGITHVIQQLSLHPQLPRRDTAVRVIGVGPCRVEGVGNVQPQLTLLLLTAVQATRGVAPLINGVFVKPMAGKLLPLLPSWAS